MNNFDLALYCYNFSLTSYIFVANKKRPFLRSQRSEAYSRRMIIFCCFLTVRSGFVDIETAKTTVESNVFSLTIISLTHRFVLLS